MFLRKFSEQEYDHYQAAINQITHKNEAIYTPKITALEDERKSLIAKGSPSQITTIAIFRPRFQELLDNIDTLNQKLDKAPTKKVQSLRAFAQPNINSKEFQSLEIPLPPLEVQNRIVKEVENVYHT